MRQKKVLIKTPFPGVEEVAKELGVSKLRTEYLKGLVTGIQIASKRRSRRRKKHSRRRIS